MSIVVGGDINGVNEIILSVNYQDTVSSSLTEIASIMNSVEDKKVEKNEKREIWDNSKKLLIIGNRLLISKISKITNITNITNDNNV